MALLGLEVVEHQLWAFLSVRVSRPRLSTQALEQAFLVCFKHSLGSFFIGSILRFQAFYPLNMELYPLVYCLLVWAVTQNGH